MPKKKKQGFSIGSAAISPSMPSAQLIAQTGKIDKNKSPEIAGEISERLAEIRSGDTRYLEEMLLSQAISLNTFAADLLLKSGGFIQEGLAVKFPELTQTLAQLALRAQDQSRKTILALHEVRNPKKPTAFIKNYIGQQLNQLQVEQQELKQQLEAATNAPMDIGSQSEAGRAYQEVETLGEQHRTRY